ncbi:hypothetical protein [uncultured Gimesia sp.]|uniref:hypothetical protein n=1 Tax=uncultured Gimesia sp. TaxID=1678688 RepID=UPI0026200932|nr:hypothetical protein [uncultured Gimesia sp.]
MTTKPSSKASKILNIILGVLLLVVLFYLFAYGFVVADAANAQLISIYEVAEVGDSLNDLKTKVAKMPQTWISSYYLPDDISISAPLQFGATNWILHIHAENDKITCIKIHSEDSINYHPQEAPPDKGNCHYRWQDKQWTAGRTINGWSKPINGSQ